jgi:arylsulfatase A-like enzyme
VVFTADHGESLTEHGYYFDHSAELYDPSLRVPLILRFPGRRWAGTRISRLAGLTDVTPTILDALRLPVPRRIDGRSLLASLEKTEGAAPAPEVPVVSAVFNRRQLLSVRTRGHKYVWTSPWWAGCQLFPEAEELFDLARDPGETNNLAVLEPALLARFRTLAAPYRPWLAPLRDSGEISAGDRQTLRSLGYLQ